MSDNSEKEDVWMQGVIGATVLICIVATSYPSKAVKSADNIYRAVVGKVEYKTIRGYRRSRDRYIVEIDFEDIDTRYRITGTNYQEAKHRKLQDNELIGDTVQLLVAPSGDSPEIYSFIWNNEDILNQDAVYNHKSINIKWALSLLVYGLLVALSKVTIGNDKPELFKYILIFGSVIIFAYFSSVYGMQYITQQNYAP